MTTVEKLRKIDARVLQVGALLGLLGYGFFEQEFDITPLQVIFSLLTTILTELIFYLITDSKVKHARQEQLPIYSLLRGFRPYSALISGISLCLLFRTNHLIIAVVAGFISIASKYLIRLNGKHIFNPTALGIFASIQFTGQAWLEPGQWGESTYLLFLIFCVGNLVVFGARRNDITLAFLGAYGLLAFGWAGWLEDPLNIPIHQVSNGAFLLFSFFMISDPKTTPNSRVGRILFACSVAVIAFYLRHFLYRPNFLIPALIYCSLLQPVIDCFLPHHKYNWINWKTGDTPCS